MALLCEIRSRTDGFLAVRVERDSGPEQDVAVRAYALAAIGLARELAAGVARETRAEAPANAMRLARHLFEQDIDVHYLVDNREAALRQLQAWEARTQLTLERKVSELGPLSAAKKRRLRAVIKEAYRLDAKAKEKEKSGAEVFASERGFPNYEQKAAAVDRLGDYAFFYGGASWMSHSGVTSLGHMLLEDGEDESVRLRPSCRRQQR